MNEMWRIRQKELELDDRLKGKSKDRISNGASYRSGDFANRRHSVAEDDGANASCSSSKDCNLRNDDGLKDEELEEFLHSRYKSKLVSLLMCHWVLTKSIHGKKILHLFDLNVFIWQGQAWQRCCWIKDG